MTVSAPRDITAIIVTYQSAAVIASCLDALGKANIPCVVVDNASTDDTRNIASRHGADIIALASNQGFGSGMNSGVRTAASNYCLLINPDATIDAASIDQLLSCAMQNPDAVIIAPQIIEPDGRIFPHGTSLLTQALPLPEANDQQAQSTRFVSGACMLVKRDWFLQQGGFDERIFLFYEDDDLCRRALDDNKQILYVPAALAEHMRGKSSPASFRHTYIIRYHQAWSRRYVCKKYGLPNPRLKLIIISAAKLLPAMLTLRRQRIARYLGSLIGNLACL